MPGTRTGFRPTDWGAYSAEMEHRRSRPLARDFVAVQGTRRHPNVHAVRAHSWGELARCVAQHATERGGPVYTCCGLLVLPTWSMVGRGARSPVTCPECFRQTAPGSQAHPHPHGRRTAAT